MKSRKKDKQLDINPDDLLDSEELIEKKINKGIGIVDNYIYIIIIHSIYNNFSTAHHYVIIAVCFVLNIIAFSSLYKHMQIERLPAMLLVTCKYTTA